MGPTNTRRCECTDRRLPGRQAGRSETRTMPTKRVFFKCYYRSPRLVWRVISGMARCIEIPVRNAIEFFSVNLRLMDWPEPRSCGRRARQYVGLCVFACFCLAAKTKVTSPYSLREWIPLGLRSSVKNEHNNHILHTCIALESTE
jgi:hypothetical protein